MIFSISSHSVVLMYIYLYTSILRPARLAANQRFPFSMYPNLGLLVKGIPMVGHNRTHTKKGFFFSLFFLFILNKKEIINTIKEIYIKKSHFFMVFKWCPLLRNFRHETCVVFSPLLLILYRMFFFLYFMFNGYETWIDTRWLFRRTELLYTNSF